MKMNLLSVFATTMLAVCSSAALAEGPILVDAPVDRIFVPLGFDDNDKVEVVISGKFSNSCYKTGPAEAFVNPLSNKIEVRAEAYYYPNAVCTQMITPFIKSVELKGQLTAGNYDVSIKERPSSPTAKLVVARSTRPEADDYLYAGVHSAFLNQNVTGGGQEIVLKGQHPFLLVGCAKFDEVRTSFSPSGVLIVQPITKIVEGEECDGSTAHIRFEHRVRLAEPLESGEFLLHVRTLNGGSVNQLLNID